MVNRYENEQALSETHRSSPEYKTMRKTVEDEQLYDTKNRILIFQEPATDTGFLTKENESVMLFSEAKDVFVFVLHLKTADPEATKTLVENLSKVASAFKADKDVLSFFPMTRIDDVKTEVTVFERFTSLAEFQRIWKEYDHLM